MKKKVGIKELNKVLIEEPYYEMKKLEAEGKARPLWGLGIFFFPDSPAHAKKLYERAIKAVGAKNFQSGHVHLSGWFVPKKLKTHGVRLKKPGKYDFVLCMGTPKDAKKKDYCPVCRV